MNTVPKGGCLVALLVLCCVPLAYAQTSSTKERSAAPKAATETLNFQTNYWDLYPRQEDVSLESLTPLPKGVAVRLKLHSDMVGFDHFQYSINGAPPRKSEDGTVVIAFENEHKAEVHRTQTTIRAVSGAGTESKPYEIDINFYPKELYAAGNRTEPGWVTVQNTDLALTSTRVEDWVVQHPTSEEKAYARKKWGNLVIQGRSDVENARALARALMDDMEPYRGIPSDTMNDLPPFEQYKRIMAGKDHVWCGNLAAVFSYACNALGIPCRTISLGRLAPVQPPATSPFRLQLAEGHATTEIYSRQRKGWVWIDLTFYALGAYLDRQGPLNTAELYMALNDPNRAGDLSLILYDPKTRQEKTVRALDSDKKASLYNYFKRDQQFSYVKTVR